MNRTILFCLLITLANFSLNVSSEDSTNESIENSDQQEIQLQLEEGNPVKTGN